MSRCPLCPRVNACIPPDGPQERGGILFIGEAPGKDEDRRAKQTPPGKPFIGKTGEEVNYHYLPLAGLRREGVIFTNAIGCLPTSTGGKLDPNRAADQALLDSCASHHLYPLIERSQPRLLVPLGSFACHAVFGEEFDLDLRHGLPSPTPWGIPAFPMFHPALGIHEPKKMLYIRTDWQRLGRYLKGTLPERTDPFAGVEDYQEVTDESCFEELDINLPLAMDTESRRGGGPFCLTYAQQPGTGRLIRAEAPILRTFGTLLQEWEGPILFHNFLYDWSVIEAMGLQLPIQRVVDTMQRVFHLGNLPQGLKALALRELGMEMQDFEDLVKPYSRQRVLTYYEAARAEDWPKPDERLFLDEKTGLWKLKKPQGMNTKFKRFFTDLSKYGEDKDVFKAWENWGAEQPMIEAKVGPWPGMCITHVPFEQVLFYACRDSDALIRLWPILDGMSRVVRDFTQEHWRDHAQIA